MKFELPDYSAPDFGKDLFTQSPLASFKPAPADGVAPENFHATAIFPEYFHISKGQWILLTRPRMDCVAVLRNEGPAPEVEAVEFRLLKKGDLVAVGRRENGEDGIYVHTEGFPGMTGLDEKFAFRTLLTRETSFSIDYDELYDLLRHERDNGFITWVLGPAVIFDSDARKAFVRLMENGYCHGLLAGNALAAHDIEGSLMGTALGQEIYSKRNVELGHYNHLQTINTIRHQGSIEKAVENGTITNGVMHSAVKNNIPYVLAGSIRDDGPLPQTIGDVYAAQDQMRAITAQSTTVIAMATQLHAIATGNMTPSYKMEEDGTIRPVYFFTVDMSEFAAGKLANRGSLTARAILTNVQDFVVHLDRALHTNE